MEKVSVATANCYTLIVRSYGQQNSESMAFTAVEYLFKVSS